MKRRGFLAGILAACVAPAVVRSGLIMPIKPALVFDADLAQRMLDDMAARYFDRFNEQLAESRRVIEEAWERDLLTYGTAIYVQDGPKLDRVDPAEFYGLDLARA